jgi:hypothetical protein
MSFRRTHAIVAVLVLTVSGLSAVQGQLVLFATEHLEALRKPPEKGTQLKDSASSFKLLAMSIGAFYST